MQPVTGTILIPRDVGAAWGVSRVEELAAQLQQRLGQPVVPGFPDDPERSVPAGIESLVGLGIQKLVVIPLSLQSVLQEGRVRQSLVWARQKWPQVEVYAAEPVTWVEWGDWLLQTAWDVARQGERDPAHVAVLLAGEGGAQPLVNANLARFAHLLREPGVFGHVGYGFSDLTRPGIPGEIDAIARGRWRDVVVVPWLMGSGDRLEGLKLELRKVVQGYALNVMWGEPRLAQDALVNILMANHITARSWSELPLDSGGEAGGGAFSGDVLSRADALELSEIERRINSLLPSEYQGRYEKVSPKSMGSAKLKFDSEGKVAWGEIWTSFCDLALAGGPPHRGTLLEAVTSEEALSEPELYQAVVSEIERGIRLTTGLPVVTSKTPGWVGIRCQDEEMAVWLMRAIIVENVMVRREGEILYLPAGPRFRVEKEVKNVITSVAKTAHYWVAHLKAKRAIRGE